MSTRRQLSNALDELAQLEAELVTLVSKSPDAQAALRRTFRVREHVLVAYELCPRAPANAQERRRLG